MAFWVARGKLVVKPIFDQAGTVVAWLSCDSILDLDGRLVAFICASDVYACSGNLLGSYLDGFFCQPDGQAVAFTESSSNGPAIPLAAIPPFGPTVIAGAIPSIPSMRDAVALRVTAWSGASWSDYLGGDASWHPINYGRRPRRPSVLLSTSRRLPHLSNFRKSPSPNYKRMDSTPRRS